MAALESAAEKLRLALLEAAAAEELHANAHREKNNMIANLRAENAELKRLGMAVVEAFHSWWETGMGEAEDAEKHVAFEAALIALRRAAM